MNKEETWAECPEFPHYDISNMGRVRNASGRILTPKRGGLFHFCKDKNIKVMKLDNKVWGAFNGPIPDGMGLIHKDTKSENCSLDNLALVTNAERRKYIDSYRMRGRRVSLERCILIKEYLASHTDRETAGEFGISEGRIKEIRLARGVYKNCPGERIIRYWKLTPDQVREIRKRYTEGELCSIMAKQFDVDLSMVYRIAVGERRGNVV